MDTRRRLSKCHSNLSPFPSQVYASVVRMNCPAYLHDHHVAALRHVNAQKTGGIVILFVQADYFGFHAVTSDRRRPPVTGCGES